jgi:predicted ester cyclase
MAGIDVFRRLFDDINRTHDPNVMDRYATKDFSFWNPITGPSDISGITMVHGAVFSGFPDIRYQADRVIEQGDNVAVEASLVGTHGGEFMGLPPTNRPVDIKVAFIGKVRGDKISELHSYLDTGGLMRELGGGAPEAVEEEVPTA